MLAAKAPPRARATNSHDERASESEPEQRERRPGDRHEHHAPPADAVGEPPPGRRAEELCGRVDGEQEAEGGGARPELPGIEREHGHHDPEADQVDDHDAEEHRERRTRRRCGRSGDGGLGSAPRAAQRASSSTFIAMKSENRYASETRKTRRAAASERSRRSRTTVATNQAFMPIATAR